MNFKTIPYFQYEKNLPLVGNHILAQQTDDHILVYQAYRTSIADYAIKHRVFGGNDYSYSRMSWIKPNFLWMMYRSGWAAKPRQERVLGIWIKKTDFEKVLMSSTFTSYAQSTLATEDEWRATLDAKPIRLQWDPDHYPNGEKHLRKAVQLGIKGELLQEFGTEMIEEIIDLSDFVKNQRPFSFKAPYTGLQVAEEMTFMPSTRELALQVGMDIQETINE